MKRLTILIILLCILPLCTSCSKPAETVEIVDDNVRNVYEIFVGSFSDSDGDGMGDLNGVTQKLDYIREMGYTAIWLMPIHPSPSYHKYDVTDYYAVDSAYGTMEDLEKLLEEAHKRDIQIYLDLVLNHTSNQHPWFLEAKKEFLSGEGGDYADWYNFSHDAQNGYAKVTSNTYYEARFVDSMPDLNLNSVSLRKEIHNILQFWLDKGVDGFRLDAVTSYYTGNNSSSITFLNWLANEARSIKSDVYLVGECWANDATIRQYYKSGIDSFFQFSLAQGDGVIAKTMNVSAPASYFKRALTSAVDLTEGHIPAIFLDNHDTNRIAGAIGRTQIRRIKFAYGLASVFNGSVYTYYGTEIGMVGSGRDENKRIAMLWDSEDQSTLCRNPANTDTAEYVYEGVKQQEKDAASILNYHKAANRLRNLYPALARGEMTFYNDLGSNTLLVLEKSWNEETAAIVINFDPEETATADLSSLNYTKCETLSVDQEAAVYKDGQLSLPPYSIAVLTNGK